jgi:uncharacterized protein (DUF1697 family)
MKTYIALFRGINVGGNNPLPMKELVAVLEGLNLYNIKTYIQSGNVIFQSVEENSELLALKISKSIHHSHGFEPKVWLLDTTVLKKAIKSNPYSEAESEPNTLHLNFLATAPTHPDLKSLEFFKADNERFQLIDNVLYLHAPDGVGKSKLFANLEKKLGVPMTSRNWRTVCKLLDLASEIAT